MSRFLRKAPIVNMNTNNVISEIVGEYNEGNCELIHKIVKNQSKLMKGCESHEDYKASIERFIAAAEA